jgi:serine/threonine protein kinase
VVVDRVSPTPSCARPLGPSRLGSRLLLGVSRTDSCRRLIVLVIEERQRSLLAGIVKLTSMTPPSPGMRIATSRPCQAGTLARQGKALGTANADAVDSSKTLVQGPIRVSDERSLRRGQPLLGRYRLLERLGAGGFGTVWRAHDELLDRTVALKRIPLPSNEDRERATREAHATARLSHPAIVSLYEASADEDAFYLISELVEGDTLAQLIADDWLSDEQLLEIGLALCAALQHAHARGVIHRDVKPHNVLVPSERTHHTPSRAAPSMTAKLADFGGARLTGDDALTRTGDVLGTLAYMAPEQSEGHEVGAAADLYSLALVMYEALTGVNPVRGRTPAATARRIGEPIESLRRRRRDLPRELTRALDTALDADPARRGTLADLDEALEDALQGGMKSRPFARRPATRRTVLDVPEWSSGQQRVPLAAPGGHAQDSGAGDTRISGQRSPLAALLDGRAQTQSRPTVARDQQRPAAHSPRLVALPRLIWTGCLLALAIWQAASGRAGVSLLLLAAGAPLLVMPRRSGPGWLTAALAPALGLAGLAGAFPALAAQCSGWRARAGLAALGFWWLALAESLLDRRLWLGPPSGLPPRAVWEGSFGKAATHVVGVTFTPELLIGAAVWALAAMILPWLVRGHSAALDVITALVWTTTLLAATPLLDRALLAHAGQQSPHGALLGAGVGCVLAVCARALRGPI